MTLSLTHTLTLFSLSSFSTLSPRKKVLGEETENTPHRGPYLDRQDPIVFMPLVVNTAGRLYDDFIGLIFLHAHRAATALANELPEESDQSQFLRAACSATLEP